MIPAFAKIQINFKRNLASYSSNLKKVVIIKSEITSSFITKYEIINEDTVNQTCIFYINDPIGVNTKLVRLFLSSNETASQENFKWELKDENVFKYDEIDASNFFIINKIDFKDQNVYKTVVKIMEANRQSVSEMKLEFRIDFDPLLFEENEYNLHLSQSDVLNQDLVKFNIKERVNNNKLEYLKNILFRITSNTNDDEFFEMNASNGWLTAKKLLTSKFYYELNVIGVSNELQKTAMAKIKITVDCFKHNKNQLINNNLHNKFKKIKYSLFENSPNRTQVGIFKSICSNVNYYYEIDQQSVDLKICSHTFKNCSFFELDLKKLNNNLDSNRLFDLDIMNGYLMTNYLISSYLLFNIVENEQKNKLDNFILFQPNVYESNRMSVIMNSFYKSSINSEYKLNYEIEILMQDAPKILNFEDTLEMEALTESHVFSEDDVKTPNMCLFNYKFPIQESMHRFVKVDSNSAHLEAEFKNNDCFASFFIYNNGCLVLKYEHLTSRLFNNQSHTCEVIICF